VATRGAPEITIEQPMNIQRRKILYLAAAGTVPSWLCRPAGAQTYPSRSVRIIVAYAPGGQTDTIARLLAQKLSDRFGTQFYVENVPGAGGNIGMARAAQAAHDGYTLAVIDVTASVVNPRLTKVGYDPFKDFDPIALPATTTQVLVVYPSLPIRTVTELVALVRANPGQYSYGSAGIGSASHLTAELFRTSLGLDLIHIPFNGAGPAIASTLGGHTPIAFGSPASTVAQVNEGSLRGLAFEIDRAVGDQRNAGRRSHRIELHFELGKLELALHSVHDAMRCTAILPCE
jgi:tripartite-type tricarboxylate transporter receptor subunit TctC